MTEVPEHLLRRSKERREALGLGGGGDAPAPAPASSSEPAAEDAPAAAASAPAVPEPAAAPAAPTPELPTYIPPPPRRVPAWMYPVLFGLPFWAIVYFGAFGSRETGPVDPLVLGQQVYQTAGCGGCHGATGGGGVGPALAQGDAKVTFPNEADHINWVKTGSAPFKGKPYGDPNRPGGQRIAKTGAMPAFSGSLSEEQIDAVVKYEREKL